MADLGYDLLVRSIGTAGAHAVTTLRNLRESPDIELATLLYQAPSLLLSGLDAQTGTTLRDLVRQTGIVVDLVPEGEPIEPGGADFDIALVVTRFDGMLTAVTEVARLLGVDARAARAILCAMPAELIGGVSASTVEAVRARFEPLGIDVDASRPRQAAFDVLVEAPDPRARALVRASIDPLASPVVEVDDHLVATGVDWTAATSIWEQLARTSTRVRVINQDFHRYDVRLEHAPRTPATIRWIGTVTGAEPTRAERAIGRTPFTLAEQVDGARTAELLAEAEAIGARASAVLLATQRFALSVAPAGHGDRTAAVDIVRAIAGDDAATQFARPSCRLLDGPYTKTLAGWLRHELRHVGVSTALVET